MKIIPYKDIRPKLNTLTVINCEHKDWFWRAIGHTAVLYWNDETKQLMVFESTTMNKFSGKSGVQLTPFGLWLHHYPGKVFARMPEFKCVWSRNVLHRKAGKFIKKHLGTSYPDLSKWGGRLKLALAALDFNLFGRDMLTYKGNDSGIFCTQLVILLYQYCGLIDSLELAREFEPDDTRPGGKAERILVECKWSEEVRLK